MFNTKYTAVELKIITLRSEALFSTNSFERIQLLREAVQLDPAEENYATPIYLGLEEYLAGNFPEAFEVFTLVLNKAPERLCTLPQHIQTQFLWRAIDTAYRLEQYDTARNWLVHFAKPQWDNNQDSQAFHALSYRLQMRSAELYAKQDNYSLALIEANYIFQKQFEDTTAWQYTFLTKQYKELSQVFLKNN